MTEELEKPRWNEADTAYILKRWGENVSASRIASELSRLNGRFVTRNMVIGRLKRMGEKQALPAHRGSGKKGSTRPRPRKPTGTPSLQNVGHGAPEKPKAAPVLRVMKPEPPAPSGHVGIMELTKQTCRWPIGDPRQTGFHFCGALPRTGEFVPGKTSPYCEFHHRMGVDVASSLKRTR